MNVYEVTITRPWDGRETVSIHMTRKGALQVACIEGLDILFGFGSDCFEDKCLTWMEDNYGTLDNPNHNLTLKELDGIFDYMEQLLWSIEMEIEVLEYTLKP